MPIIKHIPIYSAPKKLLAYIANEKKTERIYITGLHCSDTAKDAYYDFKENFEVYSNKRFFKRSIKEETAEREKRQIRLHHYIQSFKPGEVSAAEAHRIGLEWAEKVFGKNHMVLCATHIDRCHVHNHFAVAPYDLDGKHWYANKESLRRCRKISDEIAKSHGLSIVEKPKYRANHKYGEYKLRREGKSWKQNLCDEIDRLVVKDSVKSIDDLIKELEAKGYKINHGKYISIKVKPNRKAIRSFRLGDGYSLEHLEYRIANKNLEMPLSEALKYEGIQREYALCIRQIQIELYRKPEADRLHIATYREVVKSTELLFFLQENDIHSADDFKKAAADADKVLANLKNEKNELLKKIAEEEKLIEEIPKYLEVLSRKPLLSKDIKELAKYNYIKDAGVKTADDISVHQEKISDMKRQLEGMEEKFSSAYERRRTVCDFYDFYDSRMKSDYEILLEQAKEEMERIRSPEEQKKAEQETDINENVRGSSVRGAVR